MVYRVSTCLYDFTPSSLGSNKKNGLACRSFKYDPATLRSALLPTTRERARYRRKRRKANHANVLGLGNTCDAPIGTDDESANASAKSGSDTPAAIVLENSEKRYVLVCNAMPGRSDDDKENHQWEDVEGGGSGVAGSFSLFEMTSSPVSLASMRGAEVDKEKETTSTNGDDGSGDKAGPDPGSPPLVMPVTPKSAGAQSGGNGPSPPSRRRQQEFSEPQSKSNGPHERVTKETARSEMPTPPATTESNAIEPIQDAHRGDTSTSSAGTVKATILLRDLTPSHIHFKDPGLLFSPSSSSSSPSGPQAEFGVLESRHEFNNSYSHSGDGDDTAADGKKGLFVRVERWRWASTREREVAVL